MEGTEFTSRERTTGGDGKQGVDMVQSSSKPLHRFVGKEPRSFGIVLLIFGCAELLMGFLLGHTEYLYIPFWQGFLFLVCGGLSIHTEIHPSKKMVTTCLAMYLVTLLGIIVSGYNRILRVPHIGVWHMSFIEDPWDFHSVHQRIGLESVQIICSLCAMGILIFLCVIATSALKSTRTQVLVQHFAALQRDATSN